MEDKTVALIKDLGDGLVLRFSTPEDAERLAELNGRIHGEDPTDAARVAAWTRDLLQKPHPTFSTSDFVIVEKAETGEIVSSMNLISQTWEYAGIPFAIGRPELVGTQSEYRKRGLVRAQFDAVHALSRERGELVQTITGIPNFYRQFGYEMTVDLGGGRVGLPGALPKLEEGQAEPFQIRPALEVDIPFLIRMIERENRRSLLSCRMDEEIVRYELLGKSPDNLTRSEMRVIQTPEGQPVGYLVHPYSVWGGGYAALMLTRYELDQGYSFLEVTPTVMRYLWEMGQAYGKEQAHG